MTFVAVFSRALTLRSAIHMALVGYIHHLCMNDGLFWQAIYAT